MKNRKAMLMMLVITLATLLAGTGNAFAGSDVMGQPLDGSSVEMFEQGLLNVKDEGTEQEYRKVTNALKYLMYYDLSVNKDKAKLYSKLDGKTPDEIIAMMAR